MPSYSLINDCAFIVRHICWFKIFYMLLNVIIGQGDEGHLEEVRADRGVIQMIPAQVNYFDVGQTRENLRR